MKVSRCVEFYIGRKRASGYVYYASHMTLKRFARFVGDIHISTITERHVHLFLTRNAVSNNTWRRYVSCLTKFFVYWYARRQLKVIPAARPKPATKPTFFPFIYTRPEI